MGANNITLEHKKEFAKLLYTRQQLNQKMVAERVGVSEKTIGKWVNEGNWKNLRNRLLTSKETQISNFYEQLEKLNESIQNSETGIPGPKEADTQIKLTAAIKNLEQDLNIADLVESGIRFIKYLQGIESYDTVSATADLWDGFLNRQISKI